VIVPDSGCSTTYIVRTGDTLFRIAIQYGTSYQVLATANNISYPWLIYPGQQLCIR
jgi:LysM repeat protein